MYIMLGCWQFQSLKGKFTVMFKTQKAYETSIDDIQRKVDGELKYWLNFSGKQRKYEVEKTKTWKGTIQP